MPKIKPEPHVSKSIKPKDRLIPRMTMFLFGKQKTVLFAWLLLVVFGITSYATLLRREGFPSISIPVAVVNGVYAVNDPAKVDGEVAKPITDLALKQNGVSTVQTRSGDNFFSVSIQYKSGIDAQKSADELKAAVASANFMPQAAQAQYNVPYFGVTGGDVTKIDATISVYAHESDVTTQDLVAKGQKMVDYLNANKPALVQKYTLANPFQTATDPRTGQSATIQKFFDRYGERNSGENNYYNSVIINVEAVKSVDVIELDRQIHAKLKTLDTQPEFDGYHAAISASYAPAIEQEIGELQKVLLEGLIAVLVVGSFVIALRASLITVISMITVITITLAFLYIVGYTLNVITLFGLILGLSLIVDDTIIMIEAIDASRRHHTRARDAIVQATRKISRAMVAATATSVLSFAPLLFTGGILGNFIRAIPVTIIAALIISLFVALIFIPQFARHIILGKKQMGEKGVKELAAGFEAAVARAICRPMLWARRSQKKLIGVGLTAVCIGLVFIGAAGFIFQKVAFNLFPSTKDTNGLIVQMSFKPGTSVEQAHEIAAEADTIIAKELGDNFVRASYYGTGNNAQAFTVVDITPYSDRDITSQQLKTRLQQRFDSDFTVAKAVVGQMDVGPPASPFVVQIQTDDRQAGYRLADDLVKYLQSAELKRPSGKAARFLNATAANPAVYTRSEGKLAIEVSAGFDGDDTTTLVTLAQSAVKSEFGGQRLADYGLKSDALTFNIGQESDNQDSFKTLVMAFPVLLLVMYLLLAIQFRSLLQPLLIFMAVPFSLFGVTLGLYLTDNAFSFFVAMGFFALIGLSIKNTILLTDYANQSRAAGMGVIDSAVEALEERFRPLVATSLTAVVSLIPLAITSPFWQPLAVVLICGLLSSTLLVLTVFPYYYLGGEFLRLHINRRNGLAIIGLLIGGIVLGVITKNGILVLSGPLFAGLIIARLRRQSRIKKA